MILRITVFESLKVLHRNGCHETFGTLSHPQRHSKSTQSFFGGYNSSINSIITSLLLKNA